MQGWHNKTHKDFKMKVLVGHHFFIADAVNDVSACIQDTANDCIHDEILAEAFPLLASVSGLQHRQRRDRCPLRRGKR